MRNFNYNKFENWLVDKGLILFGAGYLWTISFFYLCVMSFMVEYKLPYYDFPELGLLISLIFLLLFAEVGKLKKWSFAYNDSGEFTLAHNVCINIILLFGVCFYLILDIRFFASPLYWFDRDTSLYFGSSMLTDVVRLSLIALFIINIIYSLSYTQFRKEVSYEFYILLSIAMGFLLLCVICRNLFLLLILIESVSITLVGLLCYIKKANAYEVALKFFIISAILGLIGLLGVLIIFSVCHTLDYRMLSIISCFYLIPGMSSISSAEFYFLNVGVILVISVILFKLGLFPFYMYVADFAAYCVHPLFFFFLVPLKLGFFSVLVLIYLNLFFLVDLFNTIFLFTGLASILIGAKCAVGENEFKKFLAFASINQVGFALLALSVPGYVAIISAFIFFYVYSLSTSIFLFVALHSFDHNNEEAFSYLNHFSYYSNMDKYSLSWYDTAKPSELKLNNHNKDTFGYQFHTVIIIFSFIGIPPLPGFGAKYLIFYNLFMNHNYTIVFFCPRYIFNKCLLLF